MVKKKVFLSLVLLCVVSIPSLTAWVMAHERVWIRNELDEPISVYCEFQHQGDVSYPEYWKQFKVELSKEGMDILLVG